MLVILLSNREEACIFFKFDYLKVKAFDLKGKKMLNRNAKFSIGEVVKHRIHPFRGVIFDVDPTFDNTEEWWNSIPEDHRPKKDQPFYHLLAENDSSYYIAYVSEQNLLYDDSGEPIGHPEVKQLFGSLSKGRYLLSDIMH